jgi:hypothetical protein
VFGDDLQDLIPAPTSALRQAGGTDTGTPHLFKSPLDDPILQGMKGDDSDSSTLCEQEGGINEHLFQFFKLFIHRDPQG